MAKLKDEAAQRRKEIAANALEGVITASKDAPLTGMHKQLIRALVEQTSVAAVRKSIRSFQPGNGKLNEQALDRVERFLVEVSGTTENVTRTPGRPTTSGFDKAGDQSPTVKPLAPYMSSDPWLAGDVAADPGFPGRGLPGGLAEPSSFVAPQPGAVSMGAALQLKSEQHAAEYTAPDQDALWSEEVDGNPKSRRIAARLRKAR